MSWHNAAVIHPLHESRLGRVLARYRFRLVAVVLAGIAVVNLAQIPGIERDSPFSEMCAIGRHDTSDIAAFTYDTCSWCRERYGLYLALGTVAPGARVIIPTPNSYQNNRAEQDETATRLRVYGRASQIDWVASPVAAGPGFDPQPDILVSGTGGAPEVAIDANGAAQEAAECENCARQGLPVPESSATGRRSRKRDRSIQLS